MRRPMLFASTRTPILTVLLVALAGCSDSVNDLFQSGGSGGSAGTTSNTPAATSTHSGTSVTSATTSGTNAVGSTTNTGAQTSSAVTTGMASGTTVVASSSSGPPTGPFVSCGLGGQCNVMNDVCCYDSQAKSAMCTSPNNCHQTGNALPTSISCQHPSDCQGGETCCAVRYFNADNQPYETTQCQSQCGLPDRVVCDLTNSVCPIYMTAQGQQVQSVCKASTLLPQGYYVCGF